MSEHMQVRDAEGVLEVILDRPDKYNAITGDMLEVLRESIARFASDRSLRVMRLGAVGKYFTAGMDLESEVQSDGGDSALDGRHWYRNKFHRLFDEFEAVEKPIVATHQGTCLGGGLELSLSCDFRLAAASARYGLPEIDIGALPGSGGISRLTRIAGPHWARWLVMAGEQVSAEQAVTIGFVHAVYPDGEFEQRAGEFCRRLARQPYEVMGLAKLSIELAADLDRAQARNVERISNSLLFTGSEHRRLLQAFLDRQAAKRGQRKDT